MFSFAVIIWKDASLNVLESGNKLHRKLVPSTSGHPPAALSKQQMALSRALCSSPV